MSKELLKTIGILQLSTQRDHSFVIYDDALIGRKDLDKRIRPDIDLSKLDLDRTVSRKHARIYRSGESFLIECLSLKNKILVNGELINNLSGPRKIRPGDTIFIGRLLFGFKTVPAFQIRKDLIDMLEVEVGDKSAIQKILCERGYISSIHDIVEITTLKKAVKDKPRIYSVLFPPSIETPHLIIKFGEQKETLLEKRAILEEGSKRASHFLNIRNPKTTKDDFIIYSGFEGAPLPQKICTFEEYIVERWQNRFGDILDGLEKVFAALNSFYKKGESIPSAKKACQWTRLWEALNDSAFYDLLRQTAIRHWPEQLELEEFSYLLGQLKAWAARDNTFDTRIHGRLRPANIFISLNSDSLAEKIFFVGLKHSRSLQPVAYDFAYFEVEFLQKVWSFISKDVPPKEMIRNCAKAYEKLGEPGNDNKVATGLPLYHFLFQFRKHAVEINGRQPQFMDEFLIALCCRHLLSLKEASVANDETRQMFAVAGAHLSWAAFSKARAYQNDQHLDLLEKYSQRFEREISVNKAKKVSHREVTYDSLFISYSEKDRHFVEKLYGDLKKHGVACWCSRADIKSGEKIKEQIKNNILNYDKLLVVLSDHSIESNWVNLELDLARKLNKKLHPIMIMNREKLKEWESIDADHGVDIAKNIRSYHIPDFSYWHKEEKYMERFNALLYDLRKDRGGLE